MSVNLLALFDNLGENAFLGGFTFVLGMAVVFLGMAVLVIIVEAIGKIMSSPSEKEPREKEPKVEKKVEVVQEQTDDIPEDVRVAIVAAISAYYLSNGGRQNEFKVKKIKKR
ncbi:MAG: OadG family protein [Clostridia bacterium]|nr:OadG family protein [Clostridia bacterium]